MSSKKNRKIRELLEQIYGEGCMFQKAMVEKRIEQLGGIKTYKQFKEERRYTLKKIKIFENMMTYHHLLHKSERWTHNNRKWRSYRKFTAYVYSFFTQRTRGGNK